MPQLSDYTNQVPASGSGLVRLFNEGDSDTAGNWTVFYNDGANYAANTNAGGFNVEFIEPLPDDSIGVRVTAPSVPPEQRGASEVHFYYLPGGGQGDGVAYGNQFAFLDNPTGDGGETHRIYGPSVNVNALFYAAAGGVSLDPHLSTTQGIEKAIQALGGTYAGRRVSGVIRALPGNTYPASFTALGGTHPGNYTQNGINNGAPLYWTGTPDNVICWNSGHWMTLNLIPEEGSHWASTELGGSNILAPLAGWGGQYTFSNVAGGGGAPGFVDVTISVPLSAGNVPDIEAVPADGYTGTTTLPGSAVVPVVATPPVVVAPPVVVTPPVVTPPVVTPPAPSIGLVLEVVGEAFDGTSLSVKLPPLPSGATSYTLTVTPASTGTPQTLAGLAGGVVEIVTGLVAPQSRVNRTELFDYTFQSVAVSNGGATVAQTEPLLVSLAALTPPPSLPTFPVGLDVLAFWGFAQDGKKVDIGVGYVSSIGSVGDVQRTVNVIRSSDGEADARFPVNSTPVVSIPVEVGREYTFRLAASNTVGETVSPHILKVSPQARVYGQ